MKIYTRLTKNDLTAWPPIRLDCNYCNYILFTNLPWPGDSEGTFRSSSQAATCPSVYHTRRRLHTVPLIAERQAGKLWIPVFIVFGMTRPGIEPESTVSVADALSTRPLIGYNTQGSIRFGGPISTFVPPGNFLSEALRTVVLFCSAVVGRTACTYIPTVSQSHWYKFDQKWHWFLCKAGSTSLLVAEKSRGGVENTRPEA